MIVSRLGKLFSFGGYAVVMLKQPLGCFKGEGVKFKLMIIHNYFSTFDFANYFYLWYPGCCTLLGAFFFVLAFLVSHMFLSLQGIVGCVARLFHESI